MVSGLNPTSASGLADDERRSGPVEERPLLFISYDSGDTAAATELRSFLAEDGYRIWMAPDDIRGSRPWAEQILEAISAMTMMVVLVSSRAVRSAHVAREVNLAFDQGKPVLPVRLEPVVMSGSLQYLLALVQWVDAYPAPLTDHRARLLKRIADIFDADSHQVARGRRPPNDSQPGRHNLSDRSVPEPNLEVRHPDLAATFPPLRTPDRVPNNLPSQVTAFFGRQGDVTEIQNMLADHRLVTITGVGGGGKTRLALQAAGEMLAHFPDGVWLVSLAPVTDPGLVVDTVADSVGFRQPSGRLDLESLAVYLRDRAALLVVDNCEHLIEAAATVVSRLISATSQTRVIATSRERLGFTGERVFPIPPLPLPEPNSSPASVEANPAVRLFVDRATALNPGFGTSTDMLTAVADICRRLDCLPLAIELAAARTISLTPTQIAERLDQRLRLLTGGQRGGMAHHRTLEATIDWSYQLLDPSDRQLLDKLSVFRGDFDLAAAERVCSDADLDPIDLADGMTRLVDRSLVTANPSHLQMRYRLLETIRQFASERLANSGLQESLQHRHAEHYLDVAEDLENRFQTDEQAALDGFQAEHENLMAALGWALATREIETAVRLLVALSRHFYSRGFPADSQKWVEQLLPDISTLDSITQAEFFMEATRVTLGLDIKMALSYSEQAVRLLRPLSGRPEVGSPLARALYVQGAIAARVGDIPHAIALTEEALMVARAVGDRLREARSLMNLAELAEGALETGGDLDQAADQVSQAVAILKHSPHRTALADALSVLGTIELARHRYQTAEQYLRDARKVAVEIPDPTTQLYATDSLARCLLSLGRNLEAERELVEALPLLNLGDPGAGPHLFVTLVEVYHHTNRRRAAVTILSFSASLASSIGYVPYPVLVSRIDRCESDLRQALSDSEFDTAWNDGAALTIDQAIAHAVTALDRQGKVG